MDILPQQNEEYGKQSYWDARYSQENEESTFDWFKSYSELAPYLREFLPDKSARILMLGCGNSKMSEELWDDGYKNITNIDYSRVVIEQMRRKHAETRPEMKWLHMDVRQLDFEAGSFDVAIDKGTMDAMMTQKGDIWNPPEEVVENCTREVDEVLRVLSKDSGVFLYLTFGQPHFRKPFLRRPGTELHVKELGESFHYYLYILRR